MKRTYYVCGMTWGVEMQHDGAPSQLYSSLTELKRASNCWKRDGIVKMVVDAKFVHDPVDREKDEK